MTARFLLSGVAIYDSGDIGIGVDRGCFCSEGAIGCDRSFLVDG